MSTTIPVFSSDGSTKEQLAVPERWMAVKSLKLGTIAQVATALKSRTRRVLAHTKTRGDVSGGGKKPWKQKGTGRARQGSIRSPQWKGGGVVFGPLKNRNYVLRVNKKMVRRAFESLLKEHIVEGGLAVLETNGLEATPKTKAMAKALQTIQTQWKVPGNLTMVVAGKSDMAVRRMTRNLEDCSLTETAQLGVLDLLQYPAVLFTQKAFEQFKQRVGRES